MLKIAAGLAWLGAIAAQGESGMQSWALGIGGGVAFVAGTVLQMRASRIERRIRRGLDSRSA